MTTWVRALQVSRTTSRTASIWSSSTPRMIVAFDCFRNPPELWRRVARYSRSRSASTSASRVLVVHDRDDELHAREYRRRLRRLRARRARRPGVRDAGRPAQRCPDARARPSRRACGAGVRCGLASHRGAVTRPGLRHHFRRARGRRRDPATRSPRGACRRCRGAGPRRRPRRGARVARGRALRQPSARRARRSASRTRTGPMPSSPSRSGSTRPPRPTLVAAVASPDHPLTAAARDRAEIADAAAIALPADRRPGRDRAEPRRGALRLGRRRAAAARTRPRSCGRRSTSPRRGGPVAARVDGRGALRVVRAARPHRPAHRPREPADVRPRPRAGARPGRPAGQRGLGRDLRRRRLRGDERGRRARRRRRRAAVRGVRARRRGPARRHGRPPRRRRVHPRGPGLGRFDGRPAGPRRRRRAAARSAGGECRSRRASPGSRSTARTPTRSSRPRSRRWSGGSRPARARSRPPRAERPGAAGALGLASSPASS